MQMPSLLLLQVCATATINKIPGAKKLEEINLILKSNIWIEKTKKLYKDSKLFKEQSQKML